MYMNVIRVHPGSDHDGDDGQPPWLPTQDGRRQEPEVFDDQNLQTASVLYCPESNFA